MSADTIYTLISKLQNIKSDAIANLDHDKFKPSDEILTPSSTKQGFEYLNTMRFFSDSGLSDEAYNLAFESDTIQKLISDIWLLTDGVMDEVIKVMNEHVEPISKSRHEPDLVFQDMSRRASDIVRDIKGIIKHYFTNITQRANMSFWSLLFVNATKWLKSYDMTYDVHWVISHKTGIDIHVIVRRVYATEIRELLKKHNYTNMSDKFRVIVIEEESCISDLE
jgi:hypothetical protein